MNSPLLLAAAVAAAAAPAAAAACPGATTSVDSFELGGASWTACEDLQQPGGALALAAADGRIEWFTKGHEEYADPTAVEAQYYFPALGLSKDAAMHDAADVLGQTLLSKNFSHISWEAVASAIPPIRMTGGARTFVGSRGSSVDTTFSDAGEDAAGYGFPPALGYVFNLTNEAEGGSFLSAGRGAKYINSSGMAEGLV
eukprot:COSAG04_NODE_7509_length_1116_cov_1.500492_1_plen_198_part_10